MKKILALMLSLLIAESCVLTGCGNNSESTDGSSATEAVDKVSDPIENIQATASTDKYRNFYQIFVYSFCDSDGDQVGDLQGIISQLDYLNDGDPNTGDDLGVDGIWLTPIMPSKSYHKYDVENYYDIDPEFGTLEDMDQLIAECDKRGIKLIIDLVLNHISSSHPLFIQAKEEIADNKLDGAAEYFEIHSPSYFDGNTVISHLSNGYAVEANFSFEMPEWNLNSEKTRAEFENIAKFWLERGVDGFRLDAIKYYNNKDTDGTEFLKWFYDTSKKYNPDVYMVGECWDDDSVIEGFYNSGIDSQFAFKFSSTSGQFVETINTQAGSGLVKKAMNYDNKMKDINPNAINAYFLSNHDQVRIANALEPNGLDYQKFAASVYMLLPGNSYTYYGEEIGLKAPNTTNDASYRGAMIFDSENLPDIFVNGIGDEHDAPTYGGVKQQLADESSLLNHYRRIIKIKNQNPEIARGKITEMVNFDNKQIGAYKVEYNGSTLIVAHNFNKTTDVTITVTDEIMKNPTVRADLLTTEKSKHIKIEDGKIILPPHSSVILKSAE